MCAAVGLALIFPDAVEAVLILVFAGVVVAGPLVYRILSGEKFGWFGDPRFKRPDKNEWRELCDKADRVIEGRAEINANELYELVATMQAEVEGHKRGKGTVEYEKNCERIAGLSEKLEGMDLRVHPFDTLAEGLKKDGLIEQAEKLHATIHCRCNMSFGQLRKELLAELVIIRSANWEVLGPETRTALKQSVKLLRHNPLRSVYIYGGLIVLGLGLRVYHSIVEDKGYEFYKKHPIWIAVFAVLIGVPIVILVIKFLAWKYAERENPYRLNLTAGRKDHAV